MNLISLFKPNKDGSLAFSGFFRKIFEQRKIKIKLGTYLIMGVVLIGLIQTGSAVFGQEETTLPTPKQDSVHTDLNFTQPVAGEISQSYRFYHPGIDITADLKTPIYPVTKGIIKEVGYDAWGYGNKVVIDHENGFTSLYAHMAILKVKTGELIDRNTEIGTVGLTGWTTGPHLHLEIYKDGKTINPQEILPDFSTLNIAPIN